MKYIFSALLILGCYLNSMGQVPAPSVDSLLLNWNYSIDSLKTFNSNIYKFSGVNESSIERNSYRDENGNLHTLKIKVPNGKYAAIRQRDTPNFYIKKDPTVPKKK